MSCNSLVSADIGGIAETIAGPPYTYIDNAFNNCEQLRYANYHRAVPARPDIYSYNFVPADQLVIYSAFRNCPKLSPSSTIFKNANVIEGSSFENSLSADEYKLSSIDVTNATRIYNNCFKNSTVNEFKFGDGLESIPKLSTGAKRFVFPNSTSCHVMTLENYDQITANGIDVIAYNNDPWGTIDYAGKTFDNDGLTSTINKLGIESL